MEKKEINKELENIIEKAMKQPGISELMLVYGQYDELLKNSQEYLANFQPKIVMTTTDSSM